MWKNIRCTRLLWKKKHFQVVDLSDEQPTSGASGGADTQHSNQDQQSAPLPPQTSQSQTRALTQDEVDRVVRMVFDRLIGEKPFAYAEAFMCIQIAIDRIWAEFWRSGIRIKFITTVRLRRKGQDSRYHFVSDDNRDLAFHSSWENNAMEVDVRIYNRGAWPIPMQN